MGIGFVVDVMVVMISKVVKMIGQMDIVFEICGPVRAGE
jgi:hypothetical protein